MKTIAAALLVALSGKPVTEDAIKAVLKSVGAKENAAEIKNVADALKGKKPEDVIGVRKDIARVNLVLRERELASK